MREGNLESLGFVFFGRAYLSVPLHAVTGALYGSLAALRRFDRQGSGLAGAYVLAIVIHGAFNASQSLIQLLAHLRLLWGVLVYLGLFLSIPCAGIIGARVLAGLLLRRDRQDEQLLG